MGAAASIIDRLARDGMYRGAMDSRDDWEGTLAELGEVVGRERIMLHVTSRNLHSTDAISFHTDSPIADLVAWYCVRQDPDGGATSFLDLGALGQVLDPETFEDLRLVRHRCPSQRRARLVDVPLLLDEGTAARPRFFFTPWLIDPGLDQRALAAYRAFVEALAEHEEEWVQQVRLERGEVVIIDNRRILHARRELPAHSPRLLERAWISTTPRYRALLGDDADS
ncbi:MAG TPA: TauD/TfdA family dioxygenase [Kofleriaceae bacterium]|nr:TauD/TfdA family dioxygenase [Kofleriaceae bacterium]